jgi:hypothetical protein
MDAPIKDIETQLRYWEDQLAQPAIVGDDEQAKVCERRIAEYTRLEEQLTHGSPPGAPGVLGRL